MSKVTLKTTQEQFEEAHEIVDKTRQNTKFMKIPTHIIKNLLEDHSTMVHELREDPITVVRWEEPNGEE